MATQDELYIAWSQALYKSFIYYISLTLLPLGLILNSFQIVVFARKRFYSTNMGFYFIILSIFNNFGLIAVFVAFFGISIGHDLMLLSDTSCKIIMYSIRIFPTIPSWIEVLITLNRLRFVLQSKNFKFMDRKAYILLMIAIIAFSICAFNFSNFEFFVSTATTTTNMTQNGTNHTKLAVTTTPSCTSFKEVVLMRDSIAILIRTVIPFIIIVASNSMLIRAFISSKSKFKRPNSSLAEIGGANDAISSRSHKEHCFLLSIIALDTLFVAVLAPLAVCLILLDVYAFVPSLATPTLIAAARLAYYISFYISSLPYALGFVVNFLFNRVFRTELLKMFS